MLKTIYGDTYSRSTSSLLVSDLAEPPSELIEAMLASCRTRI